MISSGSVRCGTELTDDYHPVARGTSIEVTLADLDGVDRAYAVITKP